MRRPSAVFLILMLSSLMACKGTQGGREYPVLGKDPLNDVAICRGDGEVVSSWAAKKPKKMAVVHVAPDLDFGTMPELTLDQIDRLSEQGRWAAIGRLVERDALDRGSGAYLYAAAKLGLLERIYWVMPYNWMEFTDAERRAKAYLAGRPSLISHEEIGAMKFEHGCVNGKLLGVPVSICSPETLPSPQGPVIFDMDIDFFRHYAERLEVSWLRGLKALIDNLVQRQLKVSAAFINLSEEERTTGPERWPAATELAEVLKRPDLIQKNSPPEVWSVVDSANLSMSEGNPVRAAEILEEAERRRAGDRRLSLLRGVALARMGSLPEALGLLSGACREEAGACVSLISVAREFAGAADYEASGLFSERALEFMPDSPTVLANLADIRFLGKDYQGALHLYQRIEGGEDSVAVQLRVGDCYYFLGSREEAVRRYEKGLAASDGFAHFRPSEVQRVSLGRLAELYRETGNIEGAEKIALLLAR